MVQQQSDNKPPPSVLCCVCRSTIKIDTYHPDLCVLLGISNGAPPKSLAKKHKDFRYVGRKLREEETQEPRQESDISSWHTGNAHTHTHISWILYFQRNKENLRKGKKVVSVYWRIFCLLNSEKRETKKKRHQKDEKFIRSGGGLCVCAWDDGKKKKKKKEGRQINIALKRAFSINSSHLHLRSVTYTCILWRAVS